MNAQREIRMELRFKNALLWNAFKIYMGWTTDEEFSINDLSVRLGVGRGDISQYLNLRRSPWGKKKGRHTNKMSAVLTLKKSARVIVNSLGVEVDAIFPMHLCDHEFPRVVVAEVEHSKLLTKKAAQPLFCSTEADLLQREVAGNIDAVLEILTGRHQRRVLEMRFGLKGEPPMTLEEVGAEIGVTRERVRQIEAHALRQLRHPSISRALRPLL